MLWNILFVCSMLHLTQGTMSCKEKGYTYFNNWCYRFNSSLSGNYDEALANCKSTNDNLVSIHDDATNQFVQNLDDSGVLIGLRYFNDEKLFRWSDNSEFDYDKLDSSFVQFQDYFGDCAKNKGGMWKNEECSTGSLKFVCRRPADIDTSNKRCPNDSIVYMTPGTIYSPGYPEKYDLTEELRDCIYRLAAKNNHHVKIIFDEVDLENNDGWLFVYKSWEDEFEHVQINNYYTGASLVFESNLVVVKLLGSPRGVWKLTWYSVEAETSPTSPNACPDENLVYASPGTIFSPGYPDQYSISMSPTVSVCKCTYRITAKSGQKIMLHVEVLQGNAHFHIYTNRTDMNTLDTRPPHIDSTFQGKTLAYDSAHVWMHLCSDDSLISGHFKVNFEGFADGP